MSAANDYFMNNEEQIVRFIDHELAPDQERSLLDECATNDEMRVLLKQHVSLSKHVAASLAGVAVTAATEERLAEKLAAMRATPARPAATGAGRGAIVAAVAGLTMIAFLTVAYFTAKPTVPMPAAPSAPAATVQQQPPAPTASTEPAPAQQVHRRPARRASVGTPTAEITPATAAPRPKPAKQPRKEKLTEKELVH